MNNTLRMLSEITTTEFNLMSLEQLAEQYTKDLNPSILASAFCKTFKLITSISNNYFGFSSEDIASYALETLDKCLQSYTVGKAIFTTYFTTVFRNRLRQESESLNTDKRKVYLYSNSLDSMQEDGFDIISEKQCYDEHILETTNFSDREKKYCKYLLEGYTNKEIAELLNTSIMTLSNMRKKLRLKLCDTTL